MENKETNKRLPLYSKRLKISSYLYAIRGAKIIQSSKAYLYSFNKVIGNHDILLHFIKEA